MKRKTNYAFGFFWILYLAGVAIILAKLADLLSRL